MQIQINNILAPFSVALLSGAVLLIARGVTFKLLRGWARKTETEIDNIVIKAIKNPSFVWVLTLALYISIAVSDLPEKYVLYFSKALNLLIIISVTSTLSNLVWRLLENFIRKANLPIMSTGLAHGILSGAIYTIGILIALNLLGISIAPMITALGVGGLAVALALQDTLTNLFAGIHIIAENSIRVGDFIKLENGQEGYVQNITWRTTRIRLLPNNMVVIPNSKLAQSTVTNYYLPEKRMSLQIPISVSYSSSPAKIEKVLIEETQKAVLEVQGLLGEPEPVVRFIPGFGDSSLDFTLVCQIREITDQYNVQHELRKRIFERFSAEGIEIPFPHRIVYLRQEKCGIEGAL